MPLGKRNSKSAGKGRRGGQNETMKKFDPIEGKGVGTFEQKKDQEPAI